MAVFGKFPLYHSQEQHRILQGADWLHESKVAAGYLPPSLACAWVFHEKEEDEENVKESVPLRQWVELEITYISSFFYI